MPRPKREGTWVHVEGWTGKHGRVWKDQDGTLHFHIRKQIGGRRCQQATGATSLRAALAHLDRFEADPDAYRPTGSGRKDPIYFDNALCVDFLKWSLNEKRNSAKWVGQQRLYLAWWLEKLGRIDLRRATLQEHIMPALRGATAKPQRIATLKVLYAWLRTERHELGAAEDPTYGALKVPQSIPEQHRRVKALPKEHIGLVLEHLASDRWRDLLRVLAGAGMHVAELERFAADGSIEPLPRDGRAEGAEGVIVIPSTKSGATLRVAVSADVLAAAKRVLEAGTFDRQKLTKAIHSACKVARIPAFGPGQLRHSVATAAVNAGADPARVAAFLGHKSPRTTRRWRSPPFTSAGPDIRPTLCSDGCARSVGCEPAKRWRTSSPTRSSVARSRHGSRPPLRQDSKWRPT